MIWLSFRGPGWWEKMPSVIRIDWAVLVKNLTDQKNFAWRSDVSIHFLKFTSACFPFYICFAGGLCPSSGFLKGVLERCAFSAFFKKKKLILRLLFWAPKHLCTAWHHYHDIAFGSTATTNNKCSTNSFTAVSECKATIFAGNKLVWFFITDANALHLKVPSLVLRIFLPVIEQTLIVNVNNMWTNVFPLEKYIHVQRNICDRMEESCWVCSAKSELDFTIVGALIRSYKRVSNDPLYF